jgi:hypothetical protein
LDEFAKRNAESKAKIDELRAKLAGSRDLLTDKACVYVTGSFGRGEASQHSDLDLFIVGKTDTRPKKGEPGVQEKVNRLRPLDEICLKADLIRATLQMGFPPFSGDGKFLDNHSLHEFTKALGTPRDDVTNTFTARLLLLLESRCLLEEDVYLMVIEGVLKAYWRDYEGREHEFMPAFLANDILRLWRTFCVNYEARTERVPEAEKAKGKIKNYKLKHSRLLTCWSGLLYLLAVFEMNATVTLDDASAMVQLSPIERLRWLRDVERFADNHPGIEELLRRYERFLESTNASEAELVARFSDREQSRRYMVAANEFGDLMFDVLNGIGKGGRFHRVLVI